jgi:hypothetical protein
LLALATLAACANQYNTLVYPGLRYDRSAQ